jgi:hypothetical protein
MPAGYSGTPLVKKLGIAPGMRVAFVKDPPHLAKLLGPLPDDVTLLSRPGANMDYLHVFATSQKDLSARLPKLAERLAPAGMLWISWPKKTSSISTDLSGGAVRVSGLAAGLVDVKVCAVDEGWSGHKFVIPVKDRAKRRSGR